ncbi:MAG TPA: DinB family protein [Nocardioides sp.]|nr:DinB family protein [Nocardioides sp.]
MTIERVPVPLAGDERTTLLAMLQWQRDTLRMKTEGLDAEQLDTTLPPSDLTLGGMLKHMAYVEDWWFGVTLAGRPPATPFDDVDWEADDDWDWHSASGAPPEELRALFDRFVETSDQVITAATSLDDLAERRHRKTGEGISLRWMLVHMIEEYARHNGHADLIRQSIDGATGS